MSVTAGTPTVETTGTGTTDLREIAETTVAIVNVNVNAITTGTTARGTRRTVGVGGETTTVRRTVRCPGTEIGGRGTTTKLLRRRRRTPSRCAAGPAGETTRQEGRTGTVGAGRTAAA